VTSKVLLFHKVCTDEACVLSEIRSHVNEGSLSFRTHHLIRLRPELTGRRRQVIPGLVPLGIGIAAGRGPFDLGEVERTRLVIVQGLEQV
jgi:hypothetical protein